MDKTVNTLKIVSYIFIALLVVYTIVIILLVCSYGMQLKSDEAPQEFVLKVNTFFLTNMVELLGGFGACVVINVALIGSIFGMQSKMKKQVENAVPAE